MTPTPAPVRSHTLSTFQFVLACVLLVLGLGGGVFGATLWVEGMASSAALAGLNLVFAVVIWVWFLGPAVLAGTALLIERKRRGAALALLWIGGGWHVCFAAVAALAFLPGQLP